MAVATYRAEVYITFKPGVLDPQAKTIQHALESLGFASVREVRTGKYMEIELEAADLAEAEKEVTAMCRRLLANPVLEDFRFHLTGQGVEATGGPGGAAGTARPVGGAGGAGGGVASPSL